MIKLGVEEGRMYEAHWIIYFLSFHNLCYKNLILYTIWAIDFHKSVYYQKITIARVQFLANKLIFMIYDQQFKADFSAYT
jgi:hypothetical protein